MSEGTAEGAVTTEELLRYLTELGIEATTTTHRPVFTVEEARAHRGQLAGAHTKNLFVRDKKGVMWLVVAIESQPVNLKALAQKLGYKGFSFASEQRLRRYLGVIPGSVTPFGVINDRDGSVRIALDASLRTHEIWNFHPLVNSMTTSIRRDDMIRFLEAVDHAPRWVELE